MGEIESEAMFFWKIFKFLFLLPFTLIQILFKKKEPGDLFGPAKEVWIFFWEAKVTACLIMINIFAFFAIILFVPEQMINVYFINHPGDIFKGNIFSLLGSVFFHGGLAHLFGNMLVLFVLGRVVEKHFGAIKMFTMYLAAGLISSIADSMIRFSVGDLVGSVGASGAISGMASAAMLVAPFTFTFILFGLPVPIFAVSWLFVASDVLGLIQPVEDNVGHIAHLAGFTSIMIISLFLSTEDKHKLLKGLFINLALLAVTALLWFFVLQSRLGH
ncbi:MAG: rhomboid family intramembrane serine protease [Candidatus Nanoarchaeia archaeon]